MGIMARIDSYILQKIKDLISMIRTDSRFAPSQWETSLQSNAICQWATCQIRKIVDCARAGDARNVFPATSG